MSAASSSETSTGFKIQDVFQHLWSDYTAFNPQAKRIYDLLLAREQKAEPTLHSLANDHIALRTFNIPRIGLEALSRLFERHGYAKGGEYEFKDKKLRAWHLEHPDESLPRVFISELELEKLSSFVRETAEAAAESLTTEDVSREDFLWSRRKWKASHATYLKLLEESEYAAWMYAFGFRSNHFTISFNALETFKDLQELNQFIRAQGIELNVSGGEIKGSPAVYLEQSSTLAEPTQVTFDEGTKTIPACYYEFARRYPLPDGQLYQGFVSSSADKIFESTDVKKK